MKYSIRWIVWIAISYPFMGWAEPIILLGSDTWKPKSFLEEKVPKGYAVEAAQAVLTEAGYQVETRLSTWARSVEDAKAGKGVLTHVSKTPERETFFEFSEPLVFDRIVVVVKKGKEFPFASPKDLANKVVGVLRGATYGGAWSEASKTLKIEYDVGAEARIGKLMRDRLDAAIISSGKAGLQIAAAAEGYDLSLFTILPTPVLQDPNYLAIAKDENSKKKMAVINAAIRKLHADGTIDRIMRSYGAQQ